MIIRLTIHVVIHLPREEQTQLVQKIASWLKPNGLLLANFAVDASDATVMEEWLGEKEGWMYWSSWGEEGSVTMLEEAGFKVLVRERKKVGVDAEFLWVIAQKGGS